MTAATAKTFALIATLTVAALASGCAAAPMAAPRSAGDLVLTVPVDTADGEVDVVVTGTDMARPVRARFQVEDGVARGTVYDVDAGSNRLILVTARADDGRLCAREFNASVVGSGVTEIETDALECQALHQAPARSIATARSFEYASSNDFPPLL